jgi:hypothetical protein
MQPGRSGGSSMPLALLGEDVARETARDAPKV